MSNVPLSAELDSVAGAGGLVSLIVVLILMACLGVFALMLYGLWTMRGRDAASSGGMPRVEDALGQRATVYVAIPCGESGTGKIQMSLQDRTVEYLAMTSGEKLPSGSEVVVVRVITPTTVEVQPVLGPERSSDV